MSLLFWVGMFKCSASKEPETFFYEGHLSSLKEVSFPESPGSVTGNIKGYLEITI